MPTWGLFIAGGIAAKLREKLKEGAFLHAFLNKGRSGELLKNIPVSILMNPDVGLIGAVVKAME